MAEISNNALAVLLFVAICVSAASIFSLLTIRITPITGAATTGEGVTNLTVQSVFSIKMIRNVTDFGTGDILPSGTRHIYTNSTNLGGFRNGSEGNGTDDYGTGTHVYPFVIENDGNDDTTCVQVKAGTATATFIGGTGPEFDFAGKDNESGSCTSGLQEAWLSVTTGDQTVCQSLDMDPTTDEIRVHWHLGLPDDATTGTRSNTITLTALNTC